MQAIERVELSQMIERGDDFVLVMTMAPWAFEELHIPGSVNVPDAASEDIPLSRDALIVVYCSSPACSASRLAARQMDAAGFKNILHYSGGLEDWQRAGLPLEGTRAVS